MSASFYFVSLQCVLILWSASAAVGKSLSLSSEIITFYRMLISFGTLLILFCAFKKSRSVFTKKYFVQSFSAGLFLCLHWFCFFKSIKSSNISIALICLASGPLLIKILSLFTNHKNKDLLEYALSIISFFSIMSIFKFESSYHEGLLWGFLSALFLSFNTLITEKLSHQITAISNLLLQMGSGVIFLMFYFYLRNHQASYLLVQREDVLGLLFLGLFCTTFAMLFHVKCLEKLGSFTVILCSNMEPVYGILIALFIYGQSEHMSPEFYVALTSLIICLFIEWQKKRKTSLKSKALSHKLS